MTDYQFTHNNTRADVSIDITTTVTLQAMQEFLRAHGIDTDDVPCPSVAAVADGHLTVETYVRGANRQIVLDGSDAARQRKTVPLRAPFPPQPNQRAADPVVPSGWFADVDPEEAPSTDYQWQPCLQVEAGIHSFDVWFRTEQECEDYIRRHLIGQELLPRG